MFLGTIGKRFGDAGLKGILVQSGVLAEGSADKALQGSMYNRAGVLEKAVYDIRSLADDLCQDTFNKVIAEGSLTEFSKLFDQFVSCQIKGDLSRFWLSFLEMVELLLATIYSTRSGNWFLHIECLRNITPWAFAYDRQNYSRYMTAYIGEMLNLQESHPEAYKEFVDGKFSVPLISGNTFGRNEPDKIIEDTINRDSKVAGGISGFSTNHPAVQRWNINASYRASLRRCLQETLQYEPQKHIHPDLRP
eukprot:gene1474-1632_t